MEAYTVHPLTVGQREVVLFQHTQKRCPVIYLNSVWKDSSNLLPLLQTLHCPPVHLVALTPLSWDDDLSPWAIPPLFAGDKPCSGKADAYLQWMEETLLPKVEALLPEKTWRGIAGYSLAGLFALYTLYRTDCFSRVGSMSGSLWFPHFLEFAQNTPMVKQPDFVYFSLGDRESHTNHPLLSTVEENTKALAALYQKRGIAATFQLHAGNHHTEVPLRTALGITWIASDERREKP